MPADRSRLCPNATHGHLRPRLGGFLRKVLADAVRLRVLRPREDDDTGKAEADDLVIADERGGGFVPGEVGLVHWDLVDVVLPRPAGREVVDRIVAVRGVHQDHVRVLLAQVVKRLGDQRLVLDVRRAHDRESLAFGRQRRQLLGTAGDEILPGAACGGGLAGLGGRRTLGRDPGSPDDIFVAANGDVADGLEMLDSLVEEMSAALRLLQPGRADFRAVGDIEEIAKGGAGVVMGAMQPGERPIEGVDHVVEDVLGVELGGGAVVEHSGDQLHGRLDVLGRAVVRRLEAVLVVLAAGPFGGDPFVGRLDAVRVGTVVAVVIEGHRVCSRLAVSM